MKINAKILTTLLFLALSFPSSGNPISEQLLLEVKLHSQGDGSKLFWSRNNGEHWQRATQALGSESRGLYDPTSKGLIFTRNRPKKPSKLILYHTPSAKSFRLLNFSGNEKDPTISPNGEFLAFSTQRWGRRTIGFLNLSSGIAEPLANLDRNTVYQRPSFSPQGDLLCFEAFSKGLSTLVLYDLKNSQPKLLKGPPGFYQNPQISHNGRYLACLYKARPTRAPIQLALLNLQDPQNGWHFSTPLANLSSLSWSANKEQLLLIQNEQLHFYNPHTQELWGYPLNKDRRIVRARSIQVPYPWQRNDQDTPSPTTLFPITLPQEGLEIPLYPYDSK